MSDEYLFVVSVFLIRGSLSYDPSCVLLCVRVSEISRVFLTRGFKEASNFENLSQNPLFCSRLNNLGRNIKGRHRRTETCHIFFSSKIIWLKPFFRAQAILMIILAACCCEHQMSFPLCSIVDRFWKEADWESYLFYQAWILSFNLLRRTQANQNTRRPLDLWKATLRSICRNVENESFALSRIESTGRLCQINSSAFCGWSHRHDFSVAILAFFAFFFALDRVFLDHHLCFSSSLLIVLRHDRQNTFSTSF